MANEFETFRWRTSKLIQLVEQTGPDTRLRLVEWQIMSDNESYFNVNETEFVTCVHKIITSSHTYSCLESHGGLLTYLDLFQEDVAPPDGGPAEWVDKLPFFHSDERCSITDIQCTNLKSCKANSLNHGPPEVKVSAPPPRIDTTEDHLSDFNLNNRFVRSLPRSGVAMSLRPAGPYVPHDPFEPIVYMADPEEADLPLYQYPVTRPAIPFIRTAPTPAPAPRLQISVSRYQETYPDDDPAFDDLPELS